MITKQSEKKLSERNGKSIYMIVRTLKEQEEPQLKRPKTPFFLFCSEQRELLNQKGEDRKLSSKELGQMWRNLSDS